MKIIISKTIILKTIISYTEKVCENEMLSVIKAKETLKILSKACENELYVTCKTFSNYMKTKWSREIKKYVEINLKKYVKKYEKIKAQTACNV